MLGEEEDVVEEKPVKRKRGRPKKKPEVVAETPQKDNGVVATKKDSKKVSFKGNRFEDIVKKVKIEKEDGFEHINDNHIIKEKRNKAPSEMMTCGICRKTQKVYLKYVRRGTEYKCERCEYKEKF